jgi:hypothetical protein
MSDTKKNSAQDEAVYWFAVLESARERSDFDTAAQAKKELERLGVRVSYPKKREKASVS